MDKAMQSRMDQPFQGSSGASLAWKSTLLKLKERKQYSGRTANEEMSPARIDDTEKEATHSAVHCQDFQTTSKPTKPSLKRRKKEILLRAQSAVGHKNVLPNDGNNKRMDMKNRPKTVHVFKQEPSMQRKVRSINHQDKIHPMVHSSNQHYLRNQPKVPATFRTLSSKSLSSLAKTPFKARKQKQTQENIESENEFTAEQELRMRNILNTWFQFGVVAKNKDGGNEHLSSSSGGDGRLTYWSVIRRKKKTAAEIMKEKKDRARSLFIKAYKLVSMALHYCREMVQLSHDCTVWSAVESQWYELHVSKEAQKLVFNRHKFAQNKTLTEMPRWARTILDKQPDDRTEEECRKIHAMMRSLKNFDKFTEKIQMAMCKAFIYYRIEPMRVILRQGHIGHNFYFIYSGSVFVNINDVNDSGVKFSRTEVILTKGDSFGEIALLKEVPRSATVTSREECELLVVDKEIFSTVCPRIFDIELEEKSTFIRKLPMFNHKYWSEEAIRSICFDAQIQQYKTAKVISPSSANEEWLYICMKGSARIIKCLAADETTPSGNTHRRKQLGGHDDSFLGMEEILKEKEQRKEDKRLAHDKKVLNESGNQTQAEIQPPKDTLKSRASKGLPDSKSPTPTRRISRFGRMAFSSTPRTSATMQLKRDRMFDSMQVTYTVDPLNPDDPRLRSEQGAEEMNERFSKIVHQRQHNGVITWTNLVNQNRELYKGSCDLIYLDIGSLNRGEIFDLAEMLAPSDPDTKSCLILVSAGCTVFRVKKNTVLRNMDTKSLDHAKYIARNSLYPSNEVLIKSFLEKQEWDQFKATVVENTINGSNKLKKLRPRSDTSSYNRKMKINGETKPKIPQNTQNIIRSLQADDKHEARDHALEDVIDENALAERDDVTEEFESRMLTEAKAINEKLVLKPFMPGIQRRTSTITGVSMLVTPNSARYDGVVDDSVIIEEEEEEWEEEEK